MTSSTHATVGELPALLEHLAWADARVLAGLRETPGADPRSLELFSHVLGAEHVWLARARGEAPRVAVWPTLTLEGCAALAADNAAGLRALLADAAGLDREVSYVNSAGQAFRSTVRDILLHVALHGSYHRGQVALLVRQSGGVPVATDYIALARGAPAATRV
ncbi:MAG TPA: DinB family protein [Gemmatimonadaceae bacterium]|nr:DinB family protein [Gemmatimonadaceae bacterium]